MPIDDPELSTAAITADQRPPETRPITAPAVGAHEHGAGWRGVAREFATIVAGVLVALAGQAWWSAREDRASEAAYVRQLLADTRENQRRLAASVARESAVRQSQTALATALYAPRPLPSADSLRALLDGPVFSAGTFDPVLGTYTALQSTGDLRLIRSDALRSRLVAYVALLDHDRGMQQFYIQQAFGEPSRMANIPGFTRSFADLTPAERALLKVSEDREMPRLRTDRDFAVMLFTLQISSGNRLGNLREEQRATDSLLAVLAREPALRQHMDGYVADSARSADSVRADSTRRARTAR